MKTWRSISSTLLLLCWSCSVDSARNHYFLAEKLWADRNYGAAVVEFEKVISKDPTGKFGRQALLRAALTEYLYLNRFHDSIRHFRLFVQGATATVKAGGQPPESLVADSGSSDSQPDSTMEQKLIFEAQLHIGEILYSKVERFEEAIGHYQMMLKQFERAQERPEFLYRIGKSYFYLYQFGRAIETFYEVSKKYPGSEFSVRAEYEVGLTLLTQGSEFCPKAIESFKSFVKKYPAHALAIEAEFGIASCYEELDHLDDALQKFESLRAKYVSPQVVEVKVNRIRQRLKQRHRER